MPSFSVKWPLSFGYKEWCNTIAGEEQTPMQYIRSVCTQVVDERGLDFLACFFHTMCPSPRAEEVHGVTVYVNPHCDDVDVSPSPKVNPKTTTTKKFFFLFRFCILILTVDNAIQEKVDPTVLEKLMNCVTLKHESLAGCDLELLRAIAQNNKIIASLWLQPDYTVVLDEETLALTYYRTTITAA